MANDCSFWFRAVSRDPEKLHDFVECWKTEYYAEGPHLYRISDCYETVDIQRSEDNNDLFYVECAGTCAWSLEACITMYGSSYFGGMLDGSIKKPEEIMPYDKNGRCIEILCHDYETGIEIFSEEPGCGFAEHYVVDPKGNLVIDETCDMHEYWWDRDNQTIEEFNEENGTSYTEDDFNGDDYLTVGGYANEDYYDCDYLIKDHSDDDGVNHYDMLPLMDAYEKLQKFKNYSDESMKKYKEEMREHGKQIRERREARKSELQKQKEAELKRLKAEAKKKKGGE